MASDRTGHPPGDPAGVGWMPRWTLWAIGCLAAVHLACTAWRLGVLLCLPFNVDSNEGTVLTYVTMAWEGTWYGDFRQYPHLGVHYPPLGLWLLAHIIKPLDLLQQIPAGRLLAFIAYSAATVLMALAVGNTSIADRRRMAFLALAAGVSTIHFHAFAPLFLMDPFALVFTWAGMFLMTMTPAPLRTAGAILSFLIAFNIKQTQVAAPLAVAAWLWLSNDRRRLPFLLGMAAGVLATESAGLLTGLHVDTRMHSPWSVLFSSRVADELSPGLAAYMGATLAGWYPVLAVACVAAVIGIVRRKRPMSLWDWYVLGAGGVAVALLLRIGSNFNLMGELVLAVLALTLDSLRHVALHRRRWAVALGVAQLAWTLRLPASEGLTFIMDTPDERVVQARWELYHRLEKIDGPLFCYADYDWCILTGRMPPVNLFPLPAYVANGISIDRLTEMMRNREFGALVLQQNGTQLATDRQMSYVFPDALREAMVSGYEVAGHYWEDWLHLPVQQPGD